ncbi:MAG TPA: hypothetical protein VF185_03695 [Patescibacteria group bacterium]
MSVEIKTARTKDFKTVSEGKFGNEDLPKIMEISSGPFFYRDLEVSRDRNFFKLRGKDEKIFRSTEMVATLNIPGFPEGIESPRIVCVNTPEANAMIHGRWKVREDGSIGFITPRMDHGVPMQRNIRELTRQLVQTLDFINILPSDLEKEIFITDIIRNPNVNLQEAIYLLTGMSVNTTEQKIEHIFDDDPKNVFHRIAQAGNLKAEGLDAEKCKVIAICDLYASGMQIVESFNSHLAEIGKLNGGDHHLTDLVVFAPLATLEGAVVISQIAAAQGVKTTIFTSSSILHAKEPDFYACPPFMDVPQASVDPAYLELRKVVYGEAADSACTWWNWSANRLAPSQAHSDSDKELSSFGLTNEDITERSKRVTPELMRCLGIDPRNFVTSVTIEEARAYGAVNNLERFINFSQ